MAFEYVFEAIHIHIIAWKNESVADEPVSGYDIFAIGDAPFFLRNIEMNTAWALSLYHCL